MDSKCDTDSAFSLSLLSPLLIFIIIFFSIGTCKIIVYRELFLTAWEL
jgi:hypothetical protein